MLGKWKKQQNLLKGGRGSSQAGRNGGGGGAAEKTDESAINTKALIKVGLDERTGNFIEALFAFWANKKNVMPAETFYQKMTMFGLVPDLKFIENITTIVYQSRPRAA